jgi:hypothetical protein
LSKSNGLTANSLKWIAIFAMLSDHLAWAFVPYESILSIIMHVVGMMTAPLMCFFVSEGYHKTRNVKRYALRLAIFAVISYIPYIIFETGRLPNGNNFMMLNVIYTLLLGLLALWAYNKIKRKWLRVAAIGMLFVLSLFGDWLCFAIWFILAFGCNYGDRKAQLKWYKIAVAAMMLILGTMVFITVSGISGGHITWWDFGNTVLNKLGVLFVIPLIKAYNGKKGRTVGGRWAFYIIYPAHLLLLAVLKMLIGL